MSKFYVGDLVKITSDCRSKGQEGYVSNNYNVGRQKYVTVRLKNGKIRGYNELSVKKLYESEDLNMGKLTGYKAVAVVKQSCRDWHFAIYEDGTIYKEGDRVVVSGDNQTKIIDEIITPEECARRYPSGITAEIIGLVDTSAYDERLAKRKEAEELKKQMDKKIKEMQEVDKYEMYAKQNPELAEMLAAYKELIG